VTSGAAAEVPSANDPADAEGVGAEFTVEKILDVRSRTRNAVNMIASRIEVGMTEEDAKGLASQTLTELGLRKGWHPIFVRCGANTGKDFKDATDVEVPLAENDIFFVDIGPIYDGIEGDAGDTFVFGDNPDHHRAKNDAKAIWDDVRDGWFSGNLSGRAIWEFAVETARERGWTLNPYLSGHRLADFPHKAYFNGSMSDVDLVPAPDIWVLEIALVDPDRRFGAFYEDLLLEDQTFHNPGLG
jgi:methionyl aminopeptidase